MGIKRSGKLFNPNDCLSTYAIHSYITNRLDPEKKRVVEDHLKNCALCTEAIRGYNIHKRHVHLNRDLHFISRNLRRRYIQNRSRTGFKQYAFLLLTIAAILVLIALLYILYRYFMT